MVFSEQAFALPVRVHEFENIAAVKLYKESKIEN